MQSRFIAACLVATALSSGTALAQGNPSRPQGAEQSASTTQDFVTKATIGGLFEVQSSQLALKRSQDRDVQQFAQRMIDDHDRANDKLKSLAKGMTVPSALDDAHKRMLDQLQQANGSDFADRYRQAQIDAHQQAITLFQFYAQNGSDAPIKQFAQQTLPTLQDHLQMVQRIDVASNRGAGQQRPTGGNTAYITREEPDSWRASKVVGIGVYNEQGDKIGTINELVFRKDGQVEAAVIAVGGFLGLGERYVAVPYNALQWSMTPPGRNQANNDANPAGVTPTTGAGLATSPMPSSQDPGARAPLGTQSADNGNSAQAYPDHAILPNASKDQLQRAPQFQWGSSPR